MGIEQPLSSRKGEGSEGPYIRWILLTPEFRIRQRTSPKKFAEFVLTVDQVIAASFGRCSTEPSSLHVAIAVLPGCRTIVSFRGKAEDGHASAIAEITREIRAIDAPEVVCAPVVFMRHVMIKKGEFPVEWYLAFDDFQTGYHPASLDQVLMGTVGLRVDPVPLHRNVMGILGFALSFVLPKTKICYRMVSKGLRVITRRTDIRFRGVHSKEIYELESAGPDEFTRIDFPGGGSGFVDEEMLHYMQSEAPQPTQVSLDQVSGRVRRIRVLDGGVLADAPLGRRVLLDVADQPSVDEFFTLMEIFDGPAGHCPCTGDPALELLDAEGLRVGLIGIHHGRSIRFSRWKDDARLVDGQKLLEWLAGRGVATPIAQYDLEEEERHESELELERWRGAMPDCLHALSDEVWGDVALKQDLTSLHEALAAAYPSRSAHIKRLLEWLAAGSGKWTVIPIYELLPEQLLVRFTGREIIEALETSAPTESQLEGAAKVLASEAFQKRRPDHEANLPLVLTRPSSIVCPPQPSLAEIPPEWSKRLLEHCLKSSDPEKRRRAILSFEIKH